LAFCNCLYNGFKRLGSCCFGNVGVIGNVHDQFGFITGILKLNVTLGFHIFPIWLSENAF
jgi:hypothetical protein